MCLILLAHHAHPDFPLVLAANRDEFYARPTAPAGFWKDAPHVLGGRDLTAGGTWLGLARDGRWAALTNYRDPPTARQGRPSRGALVADYLRNHPAPGEYLATVGANADAYDGFNLLVGDVTSAHYLGNRAAGTGSDGGGGDGRLDAPAHRSLDAPAHRGLDAPAHRSLEPGLYGLSNHLLDTPWPKVARGRRLLQELLDAGAPTTDALLDILYDTDVAPDDALPDTGVDTEWERALSASFIATPTYGTRASTALIIDRGGHAVFVERTFGPGPRREGDVRFDLEIAP